MPPSRTKPTDPSASPSNARSKRVTRASPSQLSQLIAMFEETHRPTKEARDALAERVGLTSTWVSNWFTRERKKADTQKEVETTNPTSAALSRHPSTMSESSASNSRAVSRVPSLSSVSDWSESYPSSSTLSPTPSLSTLPGTNYTHNFSSPYSDTSFSSFQLLPHFLNQSFTSTTSPSGYSISLPAIQAPTPGLRSYSELQFPSYTHFHKSVSSAGDPPSLQPLYNTHYLSDPHFRPMDTRDTRQNVPDQHTKILGLHETGTPDQPSKSKCLKERFGDADRDGTESETEEEATPYLGPTAVSNAPSYRVVTDGPESSATGTGHDEAPMSEADAWQKAQQHPEFATFLKIAGVRGPFRLTENGLVRGSEI